MGYRHRFYMVEKETLNKINKMNGKEFCKWGSDKGINVNEERLYVPLYEIGEELYDFGKEYDNAKEIIKTGEPLFKNRTLTKNYEEYLPYRVGKEAILCAIKHQKGLIIDYYEKLLDLKELSNIERRFREIRGITNEARYKEHITGIYEEWKNNYSPDGFAIDLDENDPRVTTSWKYEYSIFELVRLYKSIDWSKYGLVFMGW